MTPGHILVSEFCKGISLREFPKKMSDSVFQNLLLFELVSTSHLCNRRKLVDFTPSEGS